MSNVGVKTAVVSGIQVPHWIMIGVNNYLVPGFVWAAAMAFDSRLDQMHQEKMDAFKALSDELKSFRDELKSCRDELNAHFEKTNAQFEKIIAQLQKTNTQLQTTKAHSELERNQGVV